MSGALQGGQEPDYRFTLANERTFLAWARTALAILAGAMVLHQIGLPGPKWVVLGATCGLALLSGLLAAGAYRQWLHNQQAMRHAMPLPRSPLVPLLGAAVTLLSAGGVAAMLLRP
ncbi:YidH family protein [Hydrogenophaga sp.]|uniref:YidH family protein n=1 Tax=Hydrogenophaga sp. TaxID=1904254 RepID=UPI003F71E9AE